MPTAETLHCPNCGAAVSSDSSKCQFCGARLATVACPQCFGMMFIGEKFCSHCGAVAQAPEARAAAALPCPACKTTMKSVQLGKSSLFECPNCDGIWVDAATLQQICAEKEQQAAVLGMPVTPASPAAFDAKFQYRPCPLCKQLMNRLNFARFSGVIVDVCRDHGTFFDRDELRHIIEFIRSGGLDKARARQLADQEAEHERRMNAPTAAIPSSLDMELNSEDRIYSGPNAVLEVADWLVHLFK